MTRRDPAVALRQMRDFAAEAVALTAGLSREQFDRDRTLFLALTRPVELVEVFKNEIEFLHTIITATQEKRVPSPGKSDMLHFDGVILAHCNEAEWNRFQSEHTNEAIMDRIVHGSYKIALKGKSLRDEAPGVAQ